MINMNIEETILSDDLDQSITLTIVDLGLKMKIQNEHCEDDLFPGGSVEGVLNKSNLRCVKNIIKKFKDNPDKEFNEKLRFYTTNGPVILKIKKSIIENYTGIEFDIENTRVFCDIEIGKDLDLFEDYVTSALKFL